MVLLPEPFGPSSPMTSPSATENDTSRTARRGPYHLTRFCTSTTGALIEGLSGVRHRSSSHTSAMACCAPAHPLLPLPPPFRALGWPLCGYLQATPRKSRIQDRTLPHRFYCPRGPGLHKTWRPHARSHAGGG